MKYYLGGVAAALLVIACGWAFAAWSATFAVVAIESGAELSTAEGWALQGGAWLARWFAVWSVLVFGAALALAACLARRGD